MSEQFAFEFVESSLDMRDVKADASSAQEPGSRGDAKKSKCLDDFDLSTRDKLLATLKTNLAREADRAGKAFVLKDLPEDAMDLVRDVDLEQMTRILFSVHSLTDILLPKALRYRHLYGLGAFVALFVDHDAFLSASRFRCTYVSLKALEKRLKLPSSALAKISVYDPDTQLNVLFIVLRPDASGAVRLPLDDPFFLQFSLELLFFVRLASDSVNRFRVTEAAKLATASARGEERRRPRHKLSLLPSMSGTDSTTLISNAVEKESWCSLFIHTLSGTWFASDNDDAVKQQDAEHWHLPLPLCTFRKNPFSLLVPHLGCGLLPDEAVIGTKCTRAGCEKYGERFLQLFICAKCRFCQYCSRACLVQDLVDHRFGCQSATRRRTSTLPFAHDD